MKRTAFILAIMSFLMTSLQAQGGHIYSTTSGTISFQSDAPFELIKASSNDVKGLLDATKKSFAFKVKMSSFEGFNSALQQEHFNENYIESSKYPEATFTGKIIEDEDIDADGSYTIRAKGNLTIHGISQERIIKADLVVKQGKIFFKSNFTVLLSDHNIPVPKVVKDKLATEIKVEVKGQLEPR
jgi:polyisoprenoid-binding protein YceI